MFRRFLEVPNTIGSMTPVVFEVSDAEWVKAHEELVKGVEALFHTDTEHFYLDQDIGHSAYMFE